MAEAITPFPKSEQLSRRGKPQPATAEVEKKPRPTKTVEAKPVEKTEAATFAGSATELELTKIVEIRNPRVLTSQAEQKALNESVKQHGVLQPIRVSPMPDGTYQIVAGHRRFTAAKVARLKTIPAVVAIVPDETTAFTQSLVENLQREDLNPIDEAKALQTLIAETAARDPEQATQEKIGKLIGRSQPYVANALRLLELAEPVREAIEGGRLSASHGRALAGLPQERQVIVAKQAVEQKLPSKDVEEKIRREKEDAKRQAETKARHDAEALSAAERFTAFCEAKKLDPKTLMVIVGGYGHDHMRDAFIGAGAQSRSEQHDDRSSPEWTCDEQATTFKYGEYDGKFSPVCTDSKHRDAFVKERDKAKHEAAKVIEKRLTKARSTVERAIRSEDGKGLLNIDGQRLALYVLLMSPRPGEYGRSDRYEQFVKRHGGLPEGVSSAQPQDVIEAIKGLSEKDLGEELSKTVTVGMIQNVWGDLRLEDGWAVRQWLVDTFDIEADLVWGDKQPTFSVLEAWVKRGRKLTDEQQASYDKVLADRQAWNSRYGYGTATAAAADAQADDDADDPDAGDDAGEDADGE